MGGINHQYMVGLWLLFQHDPKSIYPDTDGYGSTMGYQYRFGTSRSPWKFPFWGICIPMNLGIPYNGSGWWLSPTLKNDGVKVSWDYILFPIWWKVIKFMFQTSYRYPLAEFRKSLKNQQGYSDGPESTGPKMWVYWYTYGLMTIPKKLGIQTNSWRIFSYMFTGFSRIVIVLCISIPCISMFIPYSRSTW